MEYYKIKKENKDFEEIFVDASTKGTRRKKIVYDRTEKAKAFFKYQRSDKLTESCSEKIAYEIANILGYDCAKIELGYDKSGEIGVLNYFFDDFQYYKDIVNYLTTTKVQERSVFYNIDNIINTLNSIDKKFLHGFINICIFDALIGEQDRHEENWGLIQHNKEFKIGPLFDNGDSLLRDFGNIDFANKYYCGIKQFDSYVMNSKTQIYIINCNKKYRHFELIGKLFNIDSKFIKKEIKKLKILTDNVITEIVERIPKKLMSSQHKRYITKYLIMRRNILCGL